MLVFFWGTGNHYGRNSRGHRFFVLYKQSIWKKKIRFLACSIPDICNFRLSPIGDTSVSQLSVWINRRKFKKKKYKSSGLPVSLVCMVPVVCHWTDRFVTRQAFSVRRCSNWPWVWIHPRLRSTRCVAVSIEGLLSILKGFEKGFPSGQTFWWSHVDDRLVKLTSLRHKF